MRAVKTMEFRFKLELIEFFRVYNRVRIFKVSRMEKFLQLVQNGGVCFKFDLRDSQTVL